MRFVHVLWKGIGMEYQQVPELSITLYILHFLSPYTAHSSAILLFLLIARSLLPLPQVVQNLMTCLLDHVIHVAKFVPKPE